jgi:hypothetical protein
MAGRRGSLELGLAVAPGHGSSRTTGRRVHVESISSLTRARAAVWRPGDDGEEAAVEVLDAGSTWAWREEKESRERCHGGRQSSPFI